MIVIDSKCPFVDACRDESDGSIRTDWMYLSWAIIIINSDECMNKNDHSESKKCDKRLSTVAVVVLVCVITPSIINTFVDETSVPLLNTWLGPGRLHCTDMIMGLSRISQRWIILKISGAFNSSEVAKEAHGYVGRGQINDVLRIRRFKPPVNLDRVFTRNKSPWRPLLSVMRIDRVVNLSVFLHFHLNNLLSH